MRASIEILGTDLVEQNPAALGLIDHWKRIIGLDIGWHYDLDITWILNKIRVFGLPRGATILDGGAGNGLIQFILASMGYNVLSVDFAERDVLWSASKVFRMARAIETPVETKNPYIEFIKLKTPQARIGFDMILKALRNPSCATEVVQRRLVSYCCTLVEVLAGRRSSYGRIEYLRADFTRLTSVPDESIDCVVSVSALEHNDPEAISTAVNEFTGVLKCGAPMFVTLSAAKEEDWFFEPCRGWCLTEKTIARLFGLTSYRSNFVLYEELFEKLRRSETIKRRIGRSYFYSGSNGLPWGVYDPQYQPVGVCKTKD